MRHVIILNLLYSGYRKLNKKVSVKILNLHLFAFAITHLAFHRYGKYSVDQFYEASKVWDRLEDGMQIRRMVKLESRKSLKELARVQGFEPQHSEPESDVLPLDDTRILIPVII